MKLKSNRLLFENFKIEFKEYFIHNNEKFK